jgi:hypothetical protein
MYRDGKYEEGHKSPASFKFQDPDGTMMAVSYPANPSGKIDSARFVVAFPGGGFAMPMPKLVKRLKVSLDTDKRQHFDSVLTETVKDAPAGHHNELVIWMIRKSGGNGWDVDLKVKSVKN